MQAWTIDWLVGQWLFGRLALGRNLCAAIDAARRVASNEAACPTNMETIEAAR